MNAPVGFGAGARSRSATQVHPSPMPFTCTGASSFFFNRARAVCSARKVNPDQLLSLLEGGEHLAVEKAFDHRHGRFFPRQALQVTWGRAASRGDQRRSQLGVALVFEDQEGLLQAMQHRHQLLVPDVQLQPQLARGQSVVVSQGAEDSLLHGVEALQGAAGRR